MLSGTKKHVKNKECVEVSDKAEKKVKTRLGNDALDILRKSGLENQLLEPWIRLQSIDSNTTSEWNPRSDRNMCTVHTTKEKKKEKILFSKTNLETCMYKGIYMLLSNKQY